MSAGGIPNVTLRDGRQIPILGYGVFEIPNSRVSDCVLRAVECGYRHIDTAQIYGNESGVGSAIAECGVPRGELFVTSKIWVTDYGADKAERSIDESLKKLKVDYIDLMLLHRPYFDYKGAWTALEKAATDGRVKSIGLSNFTEAQTEDIIRGASIMPAVNQIELHPFYARTALKRYLAEKDIAVEAWYPLGHGNKKLINNPVVAELAKKYGKTPSQIILNWHIARGHIIFPKTCSDAHMRENLDVFSFELAAADAEKIDALDKNKPLFTVPDWVQKLQARFSRK